MPLLPAALPRCAFLQVHAGPSLRFISSLRSSSYIYPRVTSRRSIDSLNFPSFRTFHGLAMAAKIDGTAIAKSIRQGLKTEIEHVQVTNPRFKPNLVIFQGTQDPLPGRWRHDRSRLTHQFYLVGNRSDSSWLTKRKKKRCASD